MTNDDITPEEWGDDPTERHYPYTMVGKWATYTALSAPAHLMYEIARGLLHDGDHRTRRTRRLSMEDWRVLMGVALGEKPTGRSIRRWRKELEDAGLVRLSEETFTSSGRGSLRAESRAWYVRRYPAEGAKTWESAAQILEAAALTEGDDLPVSPGHLSPHDTTCANDENAPNVSVENPFEGTSESTRGTPESTRGTSESGQTVSDLRGGAPKNSFKKSSKNLSLPYPSHEGPAERGESEIPSPPAAGNPLRITAAEAAEGAYKRLKGKAGGRTRATILKGLTGAIQVGLPPSQAVDWLNARVTGDAHSPHLIHVKNVWDLPEAEPEDAHRWAIEMCRGCNSMGVAHDPAFTRGPGSVVCLHGENPEPIMEEAQNCVECNRRLLPASQNPCGRCRRPKDPT